jgi:hypothetical protein
VSLTTAEDFAEFMAGYIDALGRHLPYLVPPISLGRNDRTVLSSLASQTLIMHVALTDRQFALICKLARKYVRQLGRAGVVVPSDIKSRRPLRAVNRASLATWNSEAEQVELRFPYEVGAVTEFRQFARQSCGPTIWHGAPDNYWSVYPSAPNLYWLQKWTSLREFEVDFEWSSLQPPNPVPEVCVQPDWTITGVDPDVVSMYTTQLDECSNDLQRLHTLSPLQATLEPQLLESLTQQYNQWQIDLTRYCQHQVPPTVTVLQLMWWINTVQPGTVLWLTSNMDRVEQIAQQQGLTICCYSGSYTEHTDLVLTDRIPRISVINQFKMFVTDNEVLYNALTFQPAKVFLLVGSTSERL